MSIRRDQPKENVFQSIQSMKSCRSNENEFNITASPEALMVAGVEDGAWFAGQALNWLEGTLKVGSFNTESVLKLAEIMQKEYHFAESLRQKQKYTKAVKECSMDIATSLDNMEFK